MSKRKTVGLHLEDGTMPTHCFAFKWGGVGGEMGPNLPPTTGNMNKKAKVVIVAEKE